MKVRIISRPIAPPWDSGSMNMAYGISSHLNPKNHLVYIPTANRFQPTYEHIIPEPIYSTRQFNLTQKLHLIKHLFTAPQVDILHFFFGVTPLSAKLFSAIKRYKKQPSILTLTHLPVKGAKPGSFGDYIVTYSTYFKKIFEDSGIKNVVTIPPGVDVKAIHPNISGIKAGNKLGIPSDAKVILYGGEYSHSAAISMLLKAITLTAKRNKNIYFVLACRIRSKYEQKRKQDIVRYLQSVPWAENVILLDTIPNMHALIARSDVCILPLQDTYGKVDLPLFLLEAMSIAKPIIITDISPVNELMIDKIGLAVPLDDANALTNAIEQMVAEGKQYGLRGRRIAEKYFSLDRITKQYAKLYAELLDE